MENRSARLASWVIDSYEDSTMFAWLCLVSKDGGAVTQRNGKIRTYWTSLHCGLSAKLGDRFPQLGEKRLKKANCLGLQGTPNRLNRSHQRGPCTRDHRMLRSCGKHISLSQHRQRVNSTKSDPSTCQPQRTGGSFFGHHDRLMHSGIFDTQIGLPALDPMSQAEEVYILRGAADKNISH